MNEDFNYCIDTLKHLSPNALELYCIVLLKMHSALTDSIDEYCEDELKALILSRYKSLIDGCK